MQAFQVVEHGPPSSLQCNSVPDLKPGPGQVHVGIRAAGINFPDVLVVSGKYQILPPRPFTPGKDFSGVVLGVGEGVSRVAAGDRVLCHVENGGFAEQAVVAEHQVFKMPEGLSFASAAAMGLVYQTAYLALIDRGHLKPGESVLVGGAAGGIGLATVQLAKGLGATVLAAVRNEEEAELVRQSGADHVIDLTQPNMRESLRAQVHAVTGGKGVDVVIDPLGDEFFAAAIRALAWCGRLVVIGFAAGGIPTLKVNYLLVKNIAVTGLQWSDYRDRTPQRIDDVQSAIFDLWQSGAVKPHVMKEFPFKELPVALELIEQGKVRGKAVIVMDR
ncbi:NADPH:quinone oxidoreductase family protein [Tardiphaga sp. OK245]|jgi:NADPH2:quinone reductase|uniref:NADPH:quinone oxidoreductase family protein n=1 Tax=Tardiphaga sp. OK245 TaxID=1855306 RepID=UPI0008A74AB8|nr:NADPH:quinone oxidoreductase family protein [Tardiphaga sp. OK245]SEH88566.1 NADPH2:quinone reductase [Tardiphaga sp. OK245]